MSQSLDKCRRLGGDLMVFWNGDLILDGYADFADSVDFGGSYFYGRLNLILLVLHAQSHKFMSSSFLDNQWREGQILA